MSDTNKIPLERWKGPPGGAPDNMPPGSGCSTAFMIITGAILLLPGACSLLYGFLVIREGAGPIFSMFLTGLLAGFVGIVLIRVARRRPTAPKGDSDAV